MIKAITKLAIASAGLWLALPAAAQFEINPDHFDTPATATAQPRSGHSRKSVRSSLPHKQAHLQHAQSPKGIVRAANTLPTLSNAPTVHRHSGVSGASRIARVHTHRRPKERSQITQPNLVLMSQQR